MSVQCVVTGRRICSTFCFIVTQPQTVRNPYVKKLYCAIKQSRGASWWNNRTDTETVQLILDSTKIARLSDSVYTELCNISCDYVMPCTLPGIRYLLMCVLNRQR